MASECNRDDALHHLSTDTGDAFATMRGKSSSYFAELAQKGEDISHAVPGLIETYFSTHQVPAMDPAAEALTRHWLSRGEIKPLLEMIAEAEYANSFSKAVEKIAEEGADLFPAIPVMVKLIASDEFLIARAAAAYGAKHPDRRDEFLLDLSREILRDEKARGMFFRLCTELQYKGESTAALLPMIVDFLADPKWRQKAADTLRWIHLGSAELAQVLPKLLAALKTQSAELQETLAMVVGNYFIGQRDWIKLDSLLNDTRPSVLKGSLYACGSKLLDKEFSDVVPELAGRIVPALFHTDPKIADLALTILEKAVENNNAFQLGKGDLQTLQAKSNQRVAQLLYRLAPRDDKPLCATCEKIKRKDSYSTDSSVPEAFPKFQKIGEHRVKGGFSLYSCHECGMYYEYSYDEEYDDMMHTLTITLNRLNTVEAAEALADDIRPAHLALIQKLEQLWATRIAHPLLWARREAVWITAEARMQRREWNNLQEFFGGGREARAELGPLFLKYSALYHDDSELRAFLEAKLDSDYEGIEYELAKSAGLIYARLKDTASLLGLLEHAAEMRRLAVLHVLWLAGRDGFDTTAFLPQLKLLVRDKNVEVRRYARYVINEAIERGEMAGAEDVMALLVEELQSGDKQRIDDACDGLGKIAEKQSIAQVLPLLGEILEKKENAWHAHEAIKTALHRGDDITPVITAMIGLVADKKYDSRLEILWTLLEAQRRKIDVSAVKTLVLDLLTDSRVQSTAVQLAQGFFEQGKILESDLAAIEKLMFKRAHDGYSEAAGNIIFDFYRARKDYAQMHTMLTHENRNVRGLSCSRMADADRDLYEISEFLPVFADNMTDKAWYVRVCSGSCLEKYAGLGEKEKRQVVDLVEKKLTGRKNK